MTKQPTEKRLHTSGKMLGVGKDGYQTGGVKIEATDPTETQTVTVKGTKRMRADKKPVKAKWF
jgi:hypothetical protein